MTTPVKPGKKTHPKDPKPAMGFSNLTSEEKDALSEPLARCAQEFLISGVEMNLAPGRME